MPKRKNPFTNPPSKSRCLTHPSTTTTTTATALPARAHAQVTKSLISALPTYHKRVLRVLKKARGFETVKLIRRIKSSRTSTAPATRPTARLEAELEALKKMKLDVLARVHLRRCVGRDGRCVRSGVLDWGVWSVEGEGEGKDREGRGMGKVEQDVSARLYGGKAVKDVMGDVLRDVRRVLGVDEGEEMARGGGDGGEDEGEGKRKIEERLGKNKGSKEAKEKRRKKKQEEEEVKSASLPTSTSDSDSDNESEHEEEEEEGEDQEDVWKGISSPGTDAFSTFDSRVAASSSASSDESESDAEPHHHHPIEEDWSASSAPKSESKPTQKLGASTFLPTLLAGYISDSYSSTSSTTPPKHKKGPPEKKQRKNRMGQQARRALWEKKYGQNAAHLKQEAQRKEKTQRREKKAGEEKKKEGQTEGKLHPSWEAARKVREGKMVVVQEVFKGGGGGKKVVFD